MQRNRPCHKAPMCRVQSNRHFGAECEVAHQNSTWSLGQRNPNSQIKRQRELKRAMWRFAFEIHCQEASEI